jgi:hypothetical protein
MTSPRHPTTKELLGMARATQEMLALVVAGLTLVMGDEPEIPYMDAKLADRVARLGEVAHRHLAFIEEHGSMTLGDSLAIRRELYGENVQATANLFGRKGSGALSRTCGARPT